MTPLSEYSLSSLSLKRKVKDDDDSSTKPATPNGKKKVKSSNNLKSGPDKSGSGPLSSSVGPGGKRGKKGPKVSN